MGKRFDLISDPIKTADTISVYVIGDEWRSAPYQETTYQGKSAALLVAGVNQKLSIGKATRIYARASNEVGDGPSASRTFTRTVNASNSSRSAEVRERVKW